jgi:hypothetical protein
MARRLYPIVPRIPWRCASPALIAADPIQVLRSRRLGRLRVAAMDSVRSVATLKRITLATLVVLGVLVLAVLALWLLPAWLTQDPHLSSPADRHKAPADARTGVVAFIAVLGCLP